MNPTKSTLPFPAGSANLSTLSPYGGTTCAPIGIGGPYEAHASHRDGSELVYVRIESTDPVGPQSTTNLAMTPEQWAAVFAIVASVAPKPVWSMVEEMKSRG